MYTELRSNALAAGAERSPARQVLFLIPFYYTHFCVFPDHACRKKSGRTGFAPSVLRHRADTTTRAARSSLRHFVTTNNVTNAKPYANDTRAVFCEGRRRNGYMRSMGRNFWPSTRSFVSSLYRSDGGGGGSRITTWPMACIGRAQRRSTYSKSLAARRTIIIFLQVIVHTGFVDYYKRIPFPFINNNFV